MPPSISPLTMARGTGQADRFLDFLGAHLLPEIEERFECDPADRTLLGWSLSGLFTLHALFTRTTMFRRYLAVSPSLPWSDGAIFAEAEAFMAADTHAPVDLFIGAGTAEETSDIAKDGWLTGVSHRQLEQILRMPRAGLRLDMTLFDGETHTTAGYPAISRGLRFLFERP